MSEAGAEDALKQLQLLAENKACANCTAQSAAGHGAVVMKANGAPLLGDALYGAQQADRLYLHAAAIAVDDVGIDVSTPPTAGAAFLSDRFAAAWAALDWAEELADRKLPKAARAFRAPPPPS